MPPSIHPPTRRAGGTNTINADPAGPRPQRRPSGIATPLDLLFDLVIVIAIAALAAAFHHTLAEGPGADALPRFLPLFVIIWWAWMPTAALAFLAGGGPGASVVRFALISALPLKGRILLFPSQTPNLENSHD